MSQVLLKQLKQAHPEIHIDVIAPAWASSLVERMPEVNHVHQFAIPHGQLKLKQRWTFGRSLAKENYRQAYVLPNTWKSALVPFAAKIPVRTGWLGEQRWGLLNDVRRLDKKKWPLMIERFFTLGATSKNCQMELPKLAINENLLKTTLAKFNLQISKPILALCPGAEYGSAKRWPAKHYAEVARQKMAEGWDVWLFGSQKDRLIADEIQHLTQDRCVDLTGRTQLGEAVDLLSQVQGVVTNDTGLMHVAAALQRPIVAIYGSSSPQFTPPLTDKAKILSLKLACSPCFKRECPLGHLKCLNELSPDLILQALGDHR